MLYKQDDIFAVFVDHIAVGIDDKNRVKEPVRKFRNGVF
jgi:hypothetical protein